MTPSAGYETPGPGDGTWTGALVEHTGELEIQVVAPTLEALYSGALELLAREVSEEEGDGRAERTISLRGDAEDSLLVALLDEATFLLERDGFVARRMRIDEATADRLDGVLIGDIDPDARPLVKAATYHGLEVVRATDGFRARVVVDV